MTTDGTSERRYRCEFVFGKRTQIRFFGITTDPVHLAPESTWTIMTNLSGTIERSVGNTFRLRTQDSNKGLSTPRTNWAGLITGSPMLPVLSGGGNWSCALICW